MQLYLALTGSLLLLYNNCIYIYVLLGEEVKGHFKCFDSLSKTTLDTRFKRQEFH